MTPSAERALVVVGAVAGSALAVAAAGRRWAVVTVTEPGLPAVHLSAGGRDLAAPVAALALAGLAASALLLVLHGWARRAVAVVLLLSAAAAALYLAGSAPELRGDRAVRWAEQRHTLTVGSTVRTELTGWPWVALLGLLLALLTGVLAAWRCRRWPDSGRRYQRRAAAVEAGAGSATESGPAELWDALDRGEDPTAERM